MKRAWGAALVAVLIALAIVLDWTGGSGRAARPGLAFITGTGTSTAQVTLASPDGSGAHPLGPGTQPLLSPDGSIVAASSTSRKGHALILYPASGAAARGFFDVSQATALAQAWSPDSRYLAVVLSSTNPASDAASGLAVIDTRTLAYRVLAHGPIYGASFAVDGSDRIVYAAAATMALSARVDVHLVAVDGSRRGQLTHDGRSLNPVWGHDAIAFDRERLRKRGAPLYQIWLMQPDGALPRQLTRLRVPALLNGLVPIGFSADQAQLLAEYEGQDTSQAWVVTLATAGARQLRLAGQTVAGAAISRRGNAVLVDLGGFLNPPDHGVVEQLSLSDGRARVLVRRGAQPSWNL